MEREEIPWETDAWNRRDNEWNTNLTRVVDLINTWCVECGITRFGSGYTTIELCVTFEYPRDATLFKLRWHYA